MQELKLIDLPAFTDSRGSFVKSFNETMFRKLNIEFSLRESYFSLSAKNVIRGMHFQLPPHHHAKIVFCPQGAILDVAVDLRKKSVDYGKVYAQILSAENHRAYYIPEGFAHGFKALTDQALTYYLVSSEYHPLCDAGISFDSIGFDWDCTDPILSDRDRSFASLVDFESPF